MNNNEHLALFILGVATLGITFLLLFAISDRDSSSIPLIDKQTQVQDVQAALTPQASSPIAPNMDALHREVAETFEKTAEYLGRGKYNEQEHIALLERLEFYSDLSSLRPEQKKAAQDFIKDMNRLLALKESVVRKVKLAEQINTAVTDAQIHLSKGKKNESEAQVLMDHIEALYAISGLSDEQNSQLRTALNALKNKYKTPERRIAGTASQSPVKAYTPEEPQKQSAPVQTQSASVQKQSAPVQTRSASVQKRSAPVQTQSLPVSKPAEPANSSTLSKPVSKAPVASTATQKAVKPDPRVVSDKFQNVMKYVAKYFVIKKYNKWQHDNLSAQLHEVEKDADALNAIDQKRLRQTIEKMDRIEEMYGDSASKN